jgi:hypothetical protein
MIAPLTEKFQILIYGKDIRLLETRKLLLASSGFRVHTVSSLEQFRSVANEKRSQYELFILCHTIPEEERLKIRAMATHQGIGLYQLERMEAPPRFIGKVADMVPPMGAGPS